MRRISDFFSTTLYILFFQSTSCCSIRIDRKSCTRRQIARAGICVTRLRPTLYKYRVCVKSRTISFWNNLNKSQRIWLKICQHVLKPPGFCSKKKFWNLVIVLLRSASLKMTPCFTEEAALCKGRARFHFWIIWTKVNGFVWNSVNICSNLWDFFQKKNCEIRLHTGWDNAGQTRTPAFDSIAQTWARGYPRSGSTLRAGSQPKLNRLSQA